MTSDPGQPLKQNPEDFLPYELSYIPDNLKKRAELELFENEEKKEDSLRALKSMLKDEADLIWQDDDAFLLCFLRARKFDLNRTFDLVKRFYTVHGKHKELYENFNFNGIRKCLNSNIYQCLPFRDSDGCVIIVGRVANWDTLELNMQDIMRTWTSVLLINIRNPANQISGFKFIFDISGFSFSHLRHASPTYLWLFAQELQNCFPARFRGMHILNENPIFYYTWSILKQFLSKKIRERWHFHGKNIQELQQFFSPSILPTQYGGELPPYDVSSWLKKAEENAEYLTEVYSYGYKKYKSNKDDKKPKSKRTHTI